MLGSQGWVFPLTRCAADNAVQVRSCNTQADCVWNGCFLMPTGIVLGSDNETFQRDACQLLDFNGGDEELGPAIEERLQVGYRAAHSQPLADTTVRL
jgi:hypothetical protein